MLQVFDVLHLDDRSTRPLPYSERRALLEELALDGPAWRTPASVVVERTEDFVARVEEQSGAGHSLSGLVIDDRELNVETAQQMGFAVIHYRDPTQLRAELRHHDVAVTAG